MRMPPEVLEDLHEFRSWERANPGFGLYEYAQASASAADFVAFLDVIEPELVLHDGEWFLATGFDAGVYSSWLVRLRDRQAVQRVLNRRNMRSLFQQDTPAYPVLEFIASAIARHWNRAFADRGLVAEAIGDGTDAQVTLARR